MIISDAINTLKAEYALGRTPQGRPIREYALNALAATLEDQKNWEMDVTKCLGCGIIISSLLVPSGCPNCNAKDMTQDVNESDII